MLIFLIINEKVQKRAAGVILGARSQSYRNVLNELGKNTLHCRKYYNRLVMCYEIVHGLVSIPLRRYFEYKPGSNVTLRGAHEYQLKPKFARTDICKTNFFYDIVSAWNSLTRHVVQQSTKIELF